MITHNKIKSVYLDTLSVRDKELIRQWRNDKAVYRWCRQNDLLNESMHDKWFYEHQLDPKIRMYIIKNENNLGVGVCGLTSMDFINQRAEFSLYISKSLQGNGYGKAALKLLCWHGFNAYPFNIIWGEGYKGNPAIDMFYKIGFVEEGLRREFYFREGKFVDAILFSIKRDELKI